MTRVRPTCLQVRFGKKRKTDCFQITTSWVFQSDIFSGPWILVIAVYKRQRFFRLRCTGSLTSPKLPKIGPLKVRLEVRSCGTFLKFLHFLHFNGHFNHSNICPFDGRHVHANSFNLFARKPNCCPESKCLHNCLCFPTLKKSWNRME